MTVLSYAQNFEDIILWRALKRIDRGFYIDIGAHDPKIDSVSKLFYENGWRGINVEPLPFKCDELRRDRPDEIVLQAAVSNEDGVIQFYVSPGGGGLSTASEEVVSAHRMRGIDVVGVTVPCVKLEHVFGLAKGVEIHWLKIDVEGLEPEVLSGWGLNDVLPWVVVVESTRPLTQEQSHNQWEHFLTDRNYHFVYFDGLNRFYLSSDHLDLVKFFSTGPNVFDEFSLSGFSSAPFAEHLVGEKLAAIAEAEEKVANAQQVRKSSEEKIARQIEILQDSALGDKALAEAEKNRELLTMRLEFDAELARLELDRSQHEVACVDRVSDLREQSRLESEARSLSFFELIKNFSDAERALHAQLKIGEVRLVKAVADKELVEQRYAAANERERALKKEFIAVKHQHHTEAEGIRIKVSSLESEVERLSKEKIEGEESAQNALAIAFAAEREAELKLLQDICANLNGMSAQGDSERVRMNEQLESLQKSFVARDESITAIVQQGFTEDQQLINMVRVELGASQKNHAELISEIHQELRIHRSIKEAMSDSLSHVRGSIDFLASSSQQGWSRRLFGSQTEKEPSQEKSETVHNCNDRISGNQEPRVVLSSSVNSPASSKDASQLMAVQPETIAEHYPSFETLKMNPTIKLQEGLRGLLSLNDTAFVKEAYRRLLRREADPEGLQHHVNWLRSGTSKIEVLDQLAGSDEALAANVKVDGLEKAVRQHRWARAPLVGNLLANVFKIEGNRPSDKRLRAIENQLQRLDARCERSFRDLENKLDSVASSIAQKVDSIPRFASTSNVGMIDDSMQTDASISLGMKTFSFDRDLGAVLLDKLAAQLVVTSEAEKLSLGR